MPATDQGVNLDRYMLVPRTLIILTRGDDVLLLHGAENKHLWAGLYNGIGGHIEKGEDIYTAAQRELYEETGLVSPNLSLCGIVTVDTQANPGVCIFVFTGHCLEGEPSSLTEGTLEWIARSEIRNIPAVADLPRLLPKIFAYNPGSQIFFAHSMYDENGNINIRFI